MTAEQNRATILVVDDTPASRYISGSWLRRCGHRVIEAATGAEALATLATTEVDLVLLDVGLPDMSGFDVCERIKSDPRLGQPVIHLSATAIRGADRVQGLTRGADVYLTEPVEPDELLATVTSLLRYYRARASAERLYLEEHSLALTLQRSFLPDRLPELPGLQIAVRYVPAARNAEIGGDFYELIELDGRRLLVAIGDVAGHSIHAATVMIELRHALRAFAVEDHTPTEILDKLERVLRHYHPTEFATLCLLLLDPERSLLQVANAGHLPPLLVEPTGTTYLAVQGPMLGLRQEQPPATVLTLPPSWEIVLITDGLIEDRVTDLDSALDELRTAISFDALPEQLCDRLIDQFGQDKPDDVALLVLRHP